MQRKRFLLIGLTVAIAIAIGFLVGSKRSSESQNNQVLGTYEVPPERVDEVKNVLNNMFWQKDGDYPLGRAQVFGSGLVVVRASQDFQKGVQQLINDLGKIKPPARSVLRIDYWLIVGEEAKTSDFQGVKSLDKVLDVVDKVDGPRKYRVLEHLSSNAKSGQEVEVEGAVAKARTQASLNNDSIDLKLEFRTRGNFGEIRSETVMKPGEYIILGQNALDPSAHVAETKIKSSAPANLYYIVHAEVAN